MTALIVINIQNDYCTGSMAIPGALDIIPKINKIRDKFDYIFFVQDSFSKYHQQFFDKTVKFPYCIKDTYGEKIPSGIITKSYDTYITKGNLNMHNADSAFYNSEGNNKKETYLKFHLNMKNISEIYLCGNYFEKTIFPTAIDGYRLGYNVNIIKNITTYIDENNMDRGLKYLETLNIPIVDLS